MSVEVSRTADGVGLLYVSSVELTGDDLLGGDARVRTEIGRNRTIRYLLVDHSAVPADKVDTEALATVANRVDSILEMIPEGLLAIVAPSDALFGLSRMYAAMAERPNLAIQVFRSLAEATEWLEPELARRNLPFQLAE